MIKKKGVLCVFTKAPEPGQVKTRLIPALGKTAATELYQSLLTRTLATACSSGLVLVRLYCTPTTEHPFLQKCANDFNVELRLQEGGDLGARMSNALEAGLDEFDFALVLGCDCPWLKKTDLKLAYSKLSSGAEVVLGPAADGGYYLLGLCALENKLFENIPWGSSSVLSETRQCLSDMSMDCFELKEYSDLDVPEDLPAYEKLIAQHHSTMG